MLFRSKGNMKKGYAFAGSNAFLAEKISSVKEVMSTLEREFFLATHKLLHLPANIYH